MCVWSGFEAMGRSRSDIKEEIAVEEAAIAEANKGSHAEKLKRIRAWSPRSVADI